MTGLTDWPMQPEGTSSRLAFCASTGRTATKFLATCLNRLDGVVGLHEGHVPGHPPLAQLSPRIIVHNRRAWQDPKWAAQLVAETRDEATLDSVAGSARLLVDVAYYNAPLLTAIRDRHTDALLFVIFRRCEGFVRSATRLHGEDPQPAGWPCRSKPLSDWESFISLGRLKPHPGHRDHASWPDWSGIQRNIWLWSTVNRHLHRFARVNANCHCLLFEHLVENPTAFWTGFLAKLGVLSPGSLTECVERSRSKINSRDAYHVGRIGSWSPAEQALYRKRALPLETDIYG